MKNAIWIIVGLLIIFLSLFMYFRSESIEGKKEINSSDNPTIKAAYKMRTISTYVSLTFDDGYLSQYEAAKILQERGIRATFFVTCLSKFENRSLMNSTQIEEIAAYHEIGWHTCHHVNMSEANASEVAPRYGAKVFAYPYGYEANQELLASYVAIRTIEWGFNNPKNCSHLQAITLTQDNFEYALSYASEAKPGDWIIFVIHDIGGNRSDVDITWQQFYELLDFIEAKGWKVVTLEENCMD